MQLYVLGSNSSDKGKQLEKLTSELLQSLGFKNVVRNQIGNGGQEIDVRAEYIVSGLDGNNRKPIICECKAYKSPVAITDWLKFLGKILIEETKGNVDGYFIALCGVNGNVSGNYKELSSKRNNIKLVTGDNLIDQLHLIFKTKSIKEIQFYIQQLTRRSPIETSYCYYEGNLYHFIGFSEDNYSILSNVGEKLTPIEAERIQPLIQQNTSYQRYIDLENESIALLRHETIKKYIVSFLFAENTRMSLSEIKVALERYGKELPEIKIGEIEDSINELIDLQLIQKQSEYCTLRLVKSTHVGVDDVVSFYKYLLTSTIPVFVIGCDLYDKYIDETLLNEICNIQGKIKIPSNEIEQTLQLLRLSPSALIYSLFPDAMIINHRQMIGGNDDLFDSEDTFYFLQKINTFLLEDYRNKGLTEYFYKKRELVEIETYSNLKIKSFKRLEFNLENKERLRLGQMSEEYNNQIILMRIFNNQPEPWENETQKPE